jgi:peptidyl-prolyl cis-trans isomerase C
LACGGGETTPDANGLEPTADPDAIVAEVNGVPITAGKVDRAWEAERLRLAAEGGPVDPETAAGLRREALNLVISGELIRQAAERSGMQVPDSEIDEQLEVVRSQFASDEEFDDYLEAGGSGRGQLREEIHRRLLLKAWVDSVTDGLDIDVGEARRIYDEQRDRFMGEEQIRVAQILARVRAQDPPAKRAAARAKMEEAHRRAIAGEDFAALAREYSESPLAAGGGDMGYFPRGRMLPEFEKVVFEIPVGQISPVFETPYGFNVVKVLDRRRADLRPFEEVKTELLMVLAREQQDKALRERVEALRAESEIRILDPDLQ